MVRMANRLSATLELPVTISWRRVPLSIRVPAVVNAHGHGSVIVGPNGRIDARQFTLSGSIFDPNREVIRAKADELLAFLQHPPIEVFKWPSPDSRRLFAWPQGVPQDWVDAGAELVVDIPMLAPDPFWYGAEVAETEEDASEWEVEVVGNAPALPVVTFEIGESGSNLALVGPGGVIELEGEYEAGDLITVDTTRFEATLTRSGDTDPINDRLSDVFVADGFVLVPGANALAYDGPAAAVTLTYRPRWY